MRPRTTRWLRILLLAVVAPPPASAQQPPDSMGCWVRDERADLELRASPYDSASIELQGDALKVCYSRPRKLDRPIMGRLVPYGEPWRLGANEATALLLPVSGTIAGVRLEPGWYALYAVPGEAQWQIVVNGERRRWGIPIDDAVRERDLGTGSVPVNRMETVVELLTLRFERTAPRAADLVMAWDRTVVRVPVRLDSVR